MTLQALPNDTVEVGVAAVACVQGGEGLLVKLVFAGIAVTLLNLCRRHEL